MVQIHLPLLSDATSDEERSDESRELQKWLSRFEPCQSRATA
jgi:hypothetical protein